MWLSVAKPQYNATAMVQLDSGNKFSNFDNVVTSAREGDPDVSRTEVEVLRSDAVVERVVHALDLTNDPEFSPTSRTWRERLTDLLPAELESLFSSLGMNIRQGGSGVPSGARRACACISAFVSSIATKSTASIGKRPWLARIVVKTLRTSVPSTSSSAIHERSRS